jgi:hypothetical protein
MKKLMGVLIVGIVLVLPFPVHAHSNAREFTISNAGTPVSWNPCEPITVIVNPTKMHKSAVRDVRIAMRRLAKASGLTLVGPVIDRTMPTLNEYGKITNYPNTITINSATPNQVPELRGTPIGGASFSHRGNRIISGMVVMDRTEKFVPGFGKGLSFGRTLLHELGHAINLGHVNDPTQIMFFNVEYDGPRNFQSGDIERMKKLFSQGCE